MTQQLFDEMIGSPPPSTVDVEAIIGTQRRHRRRRRAAAAGTVAAVVAGLLVGIGAVALDRTPTASLVPGPPSSRADTASTERRLSEALRQAVRREAPTAQLSTMVGYPGEPFTVTYRECGASNPRRQMPMAYFASAGVRMGEGVGILNVETGYDVDDLYCGSGTRMERTWTESGGPQGQKILTSFDPDALRIRIVVERSDRSYVAILHAPRWPDLDSASMSLNIDQVMKIALDPALAL